MNLIIALCLLCGCVAPYTCRSVDTREPPAQDLEPFVARHHHEGNIAELLIPLLERSLAQSEARSNERQHRRPKPGKKVIQVLPYPGSEEHKRKGWRKLNSHKKQVVEITPLHGKNGAKPLAYILSAAKPSHVEETLTNDDSVDKSTFEQQSEEKEVKVNILKSEEVSGSALSNPTSEYDSDKDSQASNKEYSSYTAESDEKSGNSKDDKNSEVSTEFRFVKQRGVKSRNHKFVVSDEEKAVTVEDDNFTGELRFTKQHGVKLRNHKGVVSDEDKAVTLEDDNFTGELRFAKQRGVKSHNHKVVVSDEAVTLEDDYFTGEEDDVTSEDFTSESFTSEDKLESRNGYVTGESQATVEKDDLYSESYVTAEESDFTSEKRDFSSENIDFTSEVKDFTSEVKDFTSEVKDFTSEVLDSTSENRDLTSEIKDLTSENRDFTSENLDLTAEKKDLTAESDFKSEIKDFSSEIKDLTSELGRGGGITAEKDVTLEALTLEDKALTLEQSSTEEHDEVTDEDVTSEAVTSEDFTNENDGVTKEILEPEHAHTHVHDHHHHHTHLDDVNVTSEEKSKTLNPNNSKHSRDFIADDLVISHHDSTEKKFGKIFDSNARDIIELIQSSVEASTAKHKDCKEVGDKHSHDHKSYRLSFLFNK